MFLNSLQLPWLDKPVLVLTSTFFQLGVVLIFCYLIRKRSDWKTGIFALGGIIIVVAMADLTSVHGFKEVFQRYRPTHNLEIGPLVQTVTNWDGNQYLGGKFGFVSSHATNLFGMATFLLLFGRPWKKHLIILLLIWPLVVSYTRIYLGVHYPLDILGGTILGTLLGMIVYLISRWAAPRLGIQPPAP